MSKTLYTCQDCGKTLSSFKPICPKCKGIDTMVETITERQSGAGLKTTGAEKPLKKVKTFSEITSKKIDRFPTGINELDRVLGGGFVDSEVVLFAGAPGSGKSTLSLKISEVFAKSGKIVLYSSGEESEDQIALRAERMGISHENIKVTYETSLEQLAGQIEEVKPNFLVLDSLQTVASSSTSGSIGGIQQSKEAAHALTRIAKTNGITMILINQIAKSGDFVGSEAVQHIVDATLMLESDSDSPLKFLRAIKNRFGSTTEVGIFQHSETGLEEVPDPSSVLVDNDGYLPGAAVGFISEGIRQIPTEIQSLVTKTNMTNPRRQFSGVDYNRTQIVCAILDKYLSAGLFEYDVFCSTVAGVKVKDPLSDLAIAASIVTSLNEKEIRERVCFVGELSLTGQVRGNFMMEEKIREADRLGFERIVVPKSVSIRNFNKDISVEKISSIRELSKILS